jgi:TatA/E family protein of Tat protein translocase
MFGSLGVSELILIFAVILIVFGPRRLPEIGKTLGKALGEFRKATDDLKNTIEREVRLEELKTIAPDIRASVNSVARSTFDPISTPEPPLLQTAEAEVGDAPAPDSEPDAPADPDTTRPEST